MNINVSGDKTIQNGRFHFKISSGNYIIMLTLIRFEIFMFIFDEIIVYYSTIFILYFFLIHRIYLAVNIIQSKYYSFLKIRRGQIV